MDVVYGRGEVSAADVEAALPDAPSYSSVRTLLRILEEKGHLRHRVDGARYIYSPTRSRAQESRSALRRVVRTFFDGSLANAVAALVDGEKLTNADLDRLEKIIRDAKNK